MIFQGRSYPLRGALGNEPKLVQKPRPADSDRRPRPAAHLHPTGWRGFAWTWTAYSCPGGARRVLAAPETAAATLPLEYTPPPPPPHPLAASRPREPDPAPRRPDASTCCSKLYSTRDRRRSSAEDDDRPRKPRPPSQPETGSAASALAEGEQALEGGAHRGGALVARRGFVQMWR